MVGSNKMTRLEPEPIDTNDSHGFAVRFIFWLSSINLGRALGVIEL